MIAGDTSGTTSSASFALPPLVLRPNLYEELLDLAVREQIGGGAVYDAVVGVTAKEAGATLLTLDGRALRVYQLLGVDYHVIG